MATISDVEQGLRELGTIDAKTSVLNKACTKKVKEVKQEFAVRMVTAAGEPLDAAEKRITAALMAWAAANRPFICSDGRKSVELNNGKIGFRASPASIGCADEATTTELLSKQVLGMLRASLASWQLEGVGVPASTLLRVKVELDKDAILEAWQAEQIITEQLAAVGLAIVPRHDQVVVSPLAVTLQPDTV